MHPDCIVIVNFVGRCIPPFLPPRNLLGRRVEREAAMVGRGPLPIPARTPDLHPDPGHTPRDHGPVPAQRAPGPDPTAAPGPDLAPSLRGVETGRALAPAAPIAGDSVGGITGNGSGHKLGTVLMFTLVLPRVINFEFPLQPHQTYYITQYEELGFS